jgi:hypothetical protein
MHLWRDGVGGGGWSLQWLAMSYDIYVVVGHRAVRFLAGFGNLTVQGRFC